MPIENKFERAEERDSPDRCQAVHPQGQCLYKAMEHSKFCPMHGGNKAGESVRKKINRQYNVAKWQQRIGEFADDDQVKSLREEIGIARLLLESVLNTCSDATDLLLYSSKIGELVTKIEKLVVSAHRLESSLGQTLDKSAALHLAAMMVTIIGKYVTDDETIDHIASEIAIAVANLNGAEAAE